MKIVQDQQVPGSRLPKTKPGEDEYEVEALDAAPGDSLQWLIIGAPGQQLHAYAVSLAFSVWGDSTKKYWTEHDYLEDLLTWQRMADPARGNDAIWAEYIAWENAFLGLKAHDCLIFNRVCLSHTPFGRAEVFDLLSVRVEQQYRTIACTTMEDLDETTPHIRGLLQREFQWITVNPSGGWLDARR